MAVQTGKVVSVALDVDYPKKDGSGSYQAYILKYVTNRGEVRDLIKPMASLKYKAPIRKALSELSAGDVFSFQTETNPQGYAEVVALTKGEPGVEMVAAAASSDTTVKPTGKVVGSTYETPEERKLKQRLIVRQAAINQAIEMNKLKHPKGVDVMPDDITVEAEAFENWVYRGME